jgi:hypothetical protein
MDKRALRQAYKDTPRPMGIYQLRRISSGMVFIGRSTDLPSILNRHRAQLRLGVHPNGALQRDWNAAGPDDFAFEVLDTLTPPDLPDYNPADDLVVLEALWLERIAPTEDATYMKRPEGRR